MAAVLKTARGASSSRVRIPCPPLSPARTWSRPPMKDAPEPALLTLLLTAATLLPQGSPPALRLRSGCRPWTTRWLGEAAPLSAYSGSRSRRGTGRPSARTDAWCIAAPAGGRCCTRSPRAGLMQVFGSLGNRRSPGPLWTSRRGDEPACPGPPRAQRRVVPRLDAGLAGARGLGRRARPGPRRRSRRG